MVLIGFSLRRLVILRFQLVFHEKCFPMVLMCCSNIYFQEELDALKARLEKVEKEKNEYKVAAEKFESRVRSFIA